MVDAWLHRKGGSDERGSEVKFARGNDRISQLAKRPDIAAEVARVRADMAEASRTYAGAQPRPPGLLPPEDPEN